MNHPAPRKPLRFHWRLPQGGERTGATRTSMVAARETALPDLEAQVEFCRIAEECQIDSLLTAFGHYMPDPIILATALGLATQRIRFMIAYRSGVVSPALFVQQLNTVSALLQGRVSLNIVAGHSPEEQRSYGDFLSHDERYERTAEFLEVAQGIWSRSGTVDFAGKYYRLDKGAIQTPFVSEDRMSPEIYIGGNSGCAEELARSRCYCWLRFADTPENLARTAVSRGSGSEIALRLGIIARRTRQEAVEAAHALIAGATSEDRRQEKSFSQASDSASIQSDFERAVRQDWLTPVLWMGAVRTHGVASASLVGSPDEIAGAIMDYKRAGVSQFVFSGWPKLDEMAFFAREVLPLVRACERRESSDG
jgi:alkanesulfonate monooxygenase